LRNSAAKIAKKAGEVKEEMGNPTILKATQWRNYE